MRETSVNVVKCEPDDETAAAAPFEVLSVVEVDDRLVIRVGGTALGIVESHACREIVERIATLRGWDPNGTQAERAFGGAGQFTREFVFADKA